MIQETWVPAQSTLRSISKFKYILKIPNLIKTNGIGIFLKE